MIFVNKSKVSRRVLFFSISLDGWAFAWQVANMKAVSIFSTVNVALQIIGFIVLVKGVMLKSYA